MTLGARGFPQYSRAARSGERGVRIVSEIVNERFHWLFKRNHQEHDFGVDGQVEVISSVGAVTGQMFAVQIKHGDSFFREKNRWGYIYRGELKHFNYLSNYPIPVIIIICNPSGQCYWTSFDPTQVRVGESSWTVTIPFDQDLQTSKARIESMLPKVRDDLSRLKEYWELNEQIAVSPMIGYVVTRSQVESVDTWPLRDFFERIRATKELAYRCQGKVEISFDGYDEDPRELYEIPEVRRFIAAAEPAVSSLFFFVRTVDPALTLTTFMLCQNAVSIEGRDHEGRRVFASCDLNQVKAFLNRHWVGLNEMTDWLGMSEDENRRISEAIVGSLGLQW